MIKAGWKEIAAATFIQLKNTFPLIGKHCLLGTVFCCCLLIFTLLEFVVFIKSFFIKKGLFNKKFIKKAQY